MPVEAWLRVLASAGPSKRKLKRYGHNTNLHDRRARKRPSLDIGQTAQRQEGLGLVSVQAQGKDRRDAVLDHRGDEGVVLLSPSSLLVVGTRQSRQSETEDTAADLVAAPGTLGGERNLLLRNSDTSNGDTLETY